MKYNITISITDSDYFYFNYTVKLGKSIIKEDTYSDSHDCDVDEIIEELKSGYAVNLVLENLQID